MPQNSSTDAPSSSVPHPQQSQSVLVRHTRTISIVSDSNISYATAVSESDITSRSSDAFFTPQSDKKEFWPHSRSPSASSFYSISSDQFYDPFPEPIVDQCRHQTSSQIPMTNFINTKHGFDNNAFIDDDGDDNKQSINFEKNKNKLNAAVEGSCTG